MREGFRLLKNNIDFDKFRLEGGKIPCGIIVFRYDGNRLEIIHASDRFFELMEYTKAEYLSLHLSGSGSKITGEAFVKKLKETLSADNKAGAFFSFEYLAPDKDGNSRWLKAEGQINDNSGGIYTITCAVIDVTSCKPDVKEWVKLTTVASLSADLLFDLDMKTETIVFSKYKNGELFHTVTYTDFESEIKSQKLIYDDDVDNFERICDNMRLGHQSVIAELRLLDRDTGEYGWYKIQGKSISDDSGVSVRVIGTILNISERKDAERRLIDKAERDPLTKIYNKATTRSLVKDYLRTDSRETFDALIIVDVDNFKKVNDNLGHLFGDSILVDLSQEMQDLFRTSDVVGRIGGDEFLVFLRGIKQRSHIESKAADICRVFELLYAGENGDKITGSLGISIFPTDGDTYDELFRKADVALYSSKNEGKNCFTFYSEADDVSLETGENLIHVNRYKRDAPLNTTSNIFDTEITDFAFDIMNKTRDVENSITLLLGKVGKHFDLSRVSILETTNDARCLKYTYQWCSKTARPQLGEIIALTEGQWNDVVQSYDGNGMNFAPDTSVIDSGTESHYCLFDAMETVSALSCAIIECGEYKGCVSFNDCVRHKIWSVDEVRALKTISKIISSYLLKMRAFEKATSLVDKLTNYDKLTGLPCFNLFRDTVTDIAKRGFEGDKFAFIYCDINNFKYINEKYGSENGDRMLCSFADKINSIDTPIKCSSRIFSDKFLIFMRIENPDGIAGDMLKFLDEFSEREKEINSECSVTSAAGIYIVEDCKKIDIGAAVDNVNIARREAKKNLENCCVVYDESMKQEITHSIEIVNKAKTALKNHEFVVYYQPKIELKTDTLVGAEALVRWKKPDGTIVRPDKFIPYLERNGFIVNVDFYVYEEVCKFIRAHLDAGKKIVPISVNVSRVHLKDPDFLKIVNGIISKYRIPSDLIEFELTESVFLENQNAAIQTMDELKKLGYLVSIDDFGSGFSSLNLLKNLPVDILKIDKEFLSNGSNFNSNDGIVVSSIINMANKMKISVICEGVETEEQVNFLRANNCDMVQGFFFARPIPENEFDSYAEKKLGE